ncbi:MAG: hypothetical protein PHF35_04920 [Candidatus Moranbacteria bacterium]|nr:hypothetical protein [Candidatus Moranbacteria bacterium]
MHNFGFYLFWVLVPVGVFLFLARRWVEKKVETLLKGIPFFLILIILLFAPAAAWGQLPEGYDSFVLVNHGRLMKIAYVSEMTKKTVDIIVRFRQFGWREPGDGECIPERPDIGVMISPQKVVFACTINKGDYDISAFSEISVNFPARRIADTVLSTALGIGVFQDQK